MREALRMQESDYVCCAGRLWSPDAAVNQRWFGEPGAVLDRPVYALLNEAQSVCMPRGAALREWTVETWRGDSVVVRLPGGAPLARRMIVVDLDAREVTQLSCVRRLPDGQLTVAHVESGSLDGESFGEMAGMVLERELVTQTIEHQIGVVADLPVGTRLTVAGAPDTLHGLVVDLVTEAVANFGAFVVRSRPGPPALLIERSGAAGPWRDDPGPVYRAFGLAADVVELDGLRLAVAV